MHLADTLHIKSNHILYILTGSLLFLTSGFLLLSLLSPFAVDNSYAVTETTQNGDYYLETTATDLNLTIHATPAGTQETASHNVTVKTDDPAGYTLTVSVDNDTSNALNLNGNTSATEKFAATSGTYASPKALDENSWGFADTLAKKNNDEWVAVPLLSNAQQLKQTNVANTSGDTTTIHYAINAKYDGKHSNGNYSNTIVYSVTGNTIPKKTLDGITYMQDVVDYSDICENSTEWTTSNNKEYTLKDKRDNLEYKVRKLKDGHCWMAQNFRMTADTLSANSHSTTLTSKDTDINGTTADFVMPSDAPWSAASAAAGKLIKGAMSASNSQAKIGSSKTAAVTGETAIARGAYYSWCTATADCSADPGMGKPQPSSICPKGWRLADPNNGSSTNDNEYYKLFNDSTNGYGGNYTNFMQAFNTYYSKGASYYLAGTWSAGSSGQYVLNAGSDGYWWSSTSHSSGANRAWRLYADTSSVNPASYYYRYGGYSIRCMF